MTSRWSDIRRSLRQSRWLIVVETVSVATVFLADWNRLIIFSKTPYLLVIAALSLRLRDVRWSSIGFYLPRHWPRLLMFGIFLGVAMELLELFVAQPAIVGITGKQPDLTDAVALAANWKLFLLALALTWTLGAFGEELVWRGWFLSRLIDLAGSNWLAQLGSLAGMAVLFGVAHADQGITGIVENTFAGAILGGAFMASGRNLLVPIVAHGITDTIDFTLIVSGHYPGL